MRVADSRELLSKHHSAMAPQQRCFCQSSKCGKSNFVGNPHCYVCGLKMRHEPCFTKPTLQHVVGSKESADARRKADAKAKAAKQQEESKKKLAKPCLCCGKKGHAKAQCHFKDDECGVCGKAGHTTATCRSKNGPKDDDEVVDLTAAVPEDSFAAEAARRGMPLLPKPQAARAPDQPATADTALAKAKVRDAAKTAFDKAVKALQTAEESVIKLQGEVVKTADAQSAAEAAYKREMAMVNAAVNPTTKLSITPAMDIGQFLDAGEDPAKLKNLTIWLGEN